jgi:L-lactate dehydrogenase complex protein LldG
MSARAAILAKLRAQRVEPLALPEIAGEWIRYVDKAEQFRVAVTEAAGRVVSADRGTAPSVVEALDVVRRASVCCSLVAGIPGNTETPSEAAEFRKVDALIVEAAFGVAENGAVWIDGASVPARAGLFLSEHLVILLRRAELVDNMHQAYERLGTELARSRYGCFMSGPSKTADIEQALVVGAHGPRSLTIVWH